MIDNDSEPAAFQQLQAGIGTRAEIMRLPQNRGWGAALNVVLRRWIESSRSRCCVICAHDAQFAPDCLDLLVSAMQREPRIGIACPQYADNTVPKLTRLHGVQVRVATPRANGTAQFIDVPHATVMIVSRDCLAEIGLFDERYFAYGDEQELGARAVRRGWKVAMIWGAIVTNPATSTPGAWRNYLFARNSLLQVRDYYGWFAAALRAVVLLVKGATAGSSSARARARGVFDYFRGRFGAPPAALSPKRSS